MATFADYVAEEKAKATGKEPPAARDPLDDELDALRAQVEAQDRAGQPGAQTERATTTATTPKQASKENARRGFASMRSEGLAEALGFGAARAGTLGVVDRAVAAGTTIGEQLGATPQTPPDPTAGATARAKYLAAEDKAAQAHPLLYHGTGLVTGAVPGIGLAKLGSGMSRFVPAAVQGGLAGAFNTRSDDPLEMAKGAGAGIGLGLATEGTLGTLLRKGVRGAPVRQENEVIKDVMESEAGRANLRTAGFQIARDIDDVRYVLREYKDVAKAARLPAKDALPVVQKRVDEARIGQPERYAKVDEALAEKGEEMTAYRLLNRLVEAEKGLPTKDRVEVQAILGEMRNDLRKTHLPEWMGTTSYAGEHVVIPTATLREWVTAAQGTASRAMGKINGTAAFKVPEAAAKVANDILEEQLDKAAVKGLGPTVAAIRESDRRSSALLAISAGLKDRGMKEALVSIGLQKRLQDANRGQELAAAGALIATGNVGAGLAAAGASPLRKALSGTARTVNDYALAPLQRAAEAGASEAILARMALEHGLPLSAVREAQNTMRAKATPGKRPVVQPSASTAVPMAPTVPPPSGYNTSTAIYPEAR